MKSIKIKGKDYIEVHERITHFWNEYPSGQILTEIVSIENGVCIIKATVLVDKIAVAVGHAYEKEDSTFINKTSYIENCETSAVGRALGIFGIGIDTSIASAEEVSNAIANQNPNDERTMIDKKDIKWLSGVAYEKILANKNAEEVTKAIDMYSTETHKMKKEYREKLIEHKDRLIAIEMNNGIDLL